ncbi:MAG: phosphotransferase [Planctomycetota bacterium]|nr:phosphotransferase [Planctomycetota bacterium]
MQPFQNLTPRGQIRRLRTLLKSALKHYELPKYTLTKINHAENTTFRLDLSEAVTLPSGAQEKSFLARVHRIGYQSEAGIRSELQWLEELGKQGFGTQQVLLTKDNQPLASAKAPGVDEAHFCSVLTWLDGRFYRKNPALSQISEMGRMTAKLHDMASQWTLPESFDRRTLDVSGIFRDGEGQLDNPEIWGAFNTNQTALFLKIRDEYQERFDALNDGPRHYGLCHFDLHLGNILFKDRQAVPIDFDDCGFAPWITDLGVTMGHWMNAKERDKYKAALLKGYQDQRSLDDLELDSLDLFIASRGVSAVLWGVDRSRVHKGFLKIMPDWIRGVEKYVEGYYSNRALSATH